MGLAVLPEWGLRQFEERVTSPAAVRWAARLVGRWQGKMPGSGLLGGIQEIRPRRTVHFVYRHSPFYRRLFERLGLHPGDIRGAADLGQQLKAFRIVDERKTE